MKTVFLWLLCICVRVQGYSVLLLPSDHTAHVKFFSVIGETVKKAGHDVTMLTFTRQKKYLSDFSISYWYQDVKDDTPTFLENQDVIWEAARKGQKNVLKFIRSVGEGMNEKCKLVFENDELMRKIQAANFDLVIMDAIDAWHCAYIIPYKFGLKYMSITALADPWLAGVSALPSFEPYHVFNGIPGTFLQRDHLVDLETFTGRLHNLLTYAAITTVRTFYPIADNALISQYVPEKPETTFRELLRKSEMFIVNLDTVCADWPRTSLPNYQYIGGVSIPTPKPVKGEMAEFLKGSDSLIVVSFGSALNKMPLDMLKKMFEAFNQIPEKVILRYDGDKPHGVPKNVLLSRWLPQNDLLALPITKLFITHGGNNGQLEAIRYGVPLLTMPVYGDQMYNGRRAEKRGYGHVLNPFTFTPPKLVKLVRKIVDNSSYSESVKQCSAILMSAPDPQERIVFWVNYILRHGGESLKHPHMDMPLWKFLMIDIIIFLSFVCIVLFSILALCSYTCLAYCCPSRHGKSKKE